MTKKSTFKRGSGCYTCRSCGRQTRATGRGDNEYTRTCAECYDLAGIENYFQDNGTDGEDAASYIAEARALVSAIKAKGGTPSFEFPELLEV